MKNRYLHSKYYEDQLEKKILKNEDFEVQKTTYTKTILCEKERIVFNESGDSDNKDMSLIKAVRDDAANYMESSDFLFKPKRIEKVNFFDLLNVLNNNEIVSKIDVKSAYWERAKQKKVISQLTDNKYKKLYEGYDSKYAKEGRLKALGSTATAKHYQLYEKSSKMSEMVDEYTIRQKTREVYLDLCRDIDDLMRDMAKEISGCKYYYWDCMFVSKEFSENAINFLKDKGYNSTCQETRVEYVKIDGIGYIISSADDKVYMTRKENGHLLDDEEEFEENFMLEDYI